METRKISRSRFDGTNTTSFKSRVAIDTNILVRALIDKNDLLAKILETAQEAHIPLPIFFETIFVLEKVYKQHRDVITNYVSTLISYQNVLTDSEILKDSVSIYRNNKNLSIIDCFALAYSNKNSLELITFDRKLIRGVK